MKWTLAQLETMTLPISVKNELSFNKEILNLNELLADFKLNINWFVAGGVPICYFLNY